MHTTSSREAPPAPLCSPAGDSRRCARGSQALVLAAALLAGAACGQKGDLYLPEPEPVAEETDEAPE